MNIVVRDAGTGQVILGKSVDMRGNTDESGRALSIGSSTDTSWRRTRESSE
jgi:hypothetical protein